MAREWGVGSASVMILAGVILGLLFVVCLLEVVVGMACGVRHR